MRWLLVFSIAVIALRGSNVLVSSKVSTHQYINLEENRYKLCNWTVEILCNVDSLIDIQDVTIIRFACRQPLCSCPENTVSDAINLVTKGNVSQTIYDACQNKRKCKTMLPEPKMRAGENVAVVAVNYSCTDCGTPARGEYSTVTTTGTVYGSVAVYSCIQGYLYESGDIQRYCLEDDQWNGTILVCAKGLKISTGEVVGTVVGAALGALAVGTFVGVAGLFVCHRLKIHLRRADTSHHGNIQLPMLGQDVIVEQGASCEMDDSTPDVNIIHDYEDLELYEMDLDRTYTTLLS